MAKDTQAPVKPGAEKAAAEPAAAEIISIHNRGIRTYHVPARVLKPGEVMSKEDRLELKPGATVEVPADVAAVLIGPNGYRDLVDAAKMAPAQSAKMANLVAENEDLRRQLAEKEKGTGKEEKPAKDK